VRAQLAVSDPLPMFRHGVTAILADLCATIDTPMDLRSWCQGAMSRLVIMSVLTNQDWLLLQELGSRPDISILVVLAENDAESDVRAYQAGAVGVVQRDVDPAQLRGAVEAILEGRAIVPIGVLRALISGHTDATVLPTAAELDWLSALAAGVTVSEIARRAGYSERMMFRLLGDVYRKLGTTRRLDAIVLAKNRGLID